MSPGLHFRLAVAAAAAVLPGSAALPGASGIAALLGLEYPPASECLAGDELGCLEEQVEAEDDGLADAARTELLQREVQMIKRRKGPKVRRLSSDKTAALVASDGHTGTTQVQWKFRERGEGSVSLEQHNIEADGYIAQAVAEIRESSVYNTTSNVDCSAYPMFCHAKLNCAGAPLSDADKVQLDRRLATPDGHANPRSWCYGYPMYATSVQKCVVEGDPAGYAREMFASQSELKLLDADAAYCFAVGHCNNTALGPRSTLQQAEAECDRLFGHERWTNAGWKEMEKVMKVAFAYEEGTLPVQDITWPEKALLIRNLSRTSALTACAMGNFHCDVIYCQETYCKSPYYRNRYAHHESESDP